MSVNIIGASQEAMEAATGEVGKEFGPLDAGAYKATVKQILIYTNSFGDKSMKYTVNITSEDRDVSFMKDINAMLKDKKENGGYANRFKQFLYAANVEESALSVKEASVEINSFGKKIMCDEIIGMVGKPVIAEVLLMNDTNKTEGEPYKLQNALSGVLAMDGTDASGENKAEQFVEKCATRPLTDYKGHIAKSKATAGTVNKNAATDAAEENF